MATKEKVKICDRCKIRVATRNCFVCGDDLCNYCKSKTDIYIAPQVNLGQIIDCCKKCIPKLKKITREDKEEILKLIKETLSADLKKRLILEKLK